MNVSFESEPKYEPIGWDERLDDHLIANEAKNEPYNRMSLLRHEMERQSESPFGGDKLIGTFFSAATNLLDADSEFKSIVDDYMAARTDITHGPYAALLLFRTIHHHARMQDADYPDISYAYSGRWKEKIAELLDVPEVKSDIINDLATKRLQSNKESRAWGPLLPLQALLASGRFERPARILEVGTGRMHLLKMLMMSGWIPGLEYEKVTVLPQGGDAVNSQVTHAVNQLAHRPMEVGKSLGIDIVPMSESEHAERVFSDSFSPSELLELKLSKVNFNDELTPAAFAARRREANYYLLDYATPPQLAFAEMNFLDPDSVDYLKSWQFDVILFSSIMYQHSSAERERDIEAAKQIASKNGIILIQDDVKVSDSDAGKTHFYESWSNDWQYNTLAIDMYNPDELQTLIEWKTNLCRTMRFGVGKLAVGSSVKTLPELLGLDPC